MIIKIIEIRIKTTNEVMNSSGGRRGRDENTMLGYESSRIAR
jgi:hypothetical protein